MALSMHSLLPQTLTSYDLPTSSSHSDIQSHEIMVHHFDCACCSLHAIVTSCLPRSVCHHVDMHQGDLIELQYTAKLHIVVNAQNSNVSNYVIADA